MACSVCGRPVLVMAFQGTGVCCENCRKARDEQEAPCVCVECGDDLAAEGMDKCLECLEAEWVGRPG